MNPQQVPSRANLLLEAGLQNLSLTATSGTVTYCIRDDWEATDDDD